VYTLDADPLTFLGPWRRVILFCVDLVRTMAINLFPPVHPLFPAIALTPSPLSPNGTTASLNPTSHPRFPSSPSLHTPFSLDIGFSCLIPCMSDHMVFLFFPKSWFNCCCVGVAFRSLAGMSDLPAHLVCFAPLAITALFVAPSPCPRRFSFFC